MSAVDSHLARIARVRCGPLVLALLLVLPGLAWGQARGGPGPTPARIAVRILPVGQETPARMVLQAVHHGGVAFVDIDALGLAGGAPAGLRDLEEEARALELRFAFREAVERWREVVERLSNARTVLLVPGRVARARVGLAAAYANAGERDLAILEFRKALALDAGITAGPEYPPAVRELFAEARRQGPALPVAPDDAVLERLATEAGVEGILWLATGREEGRRYLVRRLHRVGRQGSEEVRVRLPEEAPAARAIAMREGKQLEEELRQAFPEPPPPPPPWHENPLVWGSAIGLSAAAVAGVVLALTLGREKVDVVLRY
ncbi:MAG: hypothetical protein D6729_03545 [Deltaproteobacteria bacterium]|nr:MAG: hypothetical protein D6729_03545 [Deltaproteobacteria bacterium]